MSKNQKTKPVEEKTQDPVDEITQDNTKQIQDEVETTDETEKTDEVEKPDETEKTDEVETTDETEKTDEEQQKLKARCEAYLHSSFGWRQAINLFYAIEKNPSKRIKVVNLGDSPAGRSIIEAAVKDFING